MRVRDKAAVLIVAELTSNCLKRDQKSGSVRMSELARVSSDGMRKLTL